METTKNNTSTKPQLNARGGIDRQSSRESSGLVSSGSTGSGSQLTQPVITAEALAPTPTPILAPEKTPVQTASMLGNLQSATDSYTQGLKDKAATDDVGRATALDAYLNAQKSARGVTSMQNDAYAVSGGVNDITPELNDINDRIRQEQRGLDLAKRAVTEKGGGLKSGAAAELSNLERVSLQKQADLSIIQMAVQGRYDSAKEIADRAVSARFEQQQNDLDVARFNYTENKDIFTKSEQRAFESEQADRERKLTEERENANAIYDLGIKAQQDGAPAGVVERMLAAKTKQEAAAIGGSYIGALDRESKRASIANANRRQTQIVDLNGVKTLVDSQTGEVISKIQNDTPESNAFANALASNSVDNISSILNNTAIGSAVGPSGLARTEPGLWGAAKRFFTGALTGGAAGAAAGSVFGGVGAIPGAIIGALTTGVVNASRGSMDQLTGDRQNFIGSVENMRSELTKDKLAQAKGEGVTFGALSDGERQLIANAATKIGTWAITEDGTVNGKVTGYNIDEESFKREMDTINYFKVLDAVIQGTPPESLGVITQPDGTMWIANSDGTLSELQRQ